MTKLFAFLFLVFATSSLFSQNKAIDSLVALIEKHRAEDTMRVNLLNSLALELQDVGSDQSVVKAKEAYRISHKLNFFRGEGAALRRIGTYYYVRADYANALQSYDLALRLATRNNDAAAMAWGLNGKGTVFHSQSNYPEAVANYLQAVQLFEKTGEQHNAASIMGNVGVLYKEMGKFDSAKAYFERGLNIHEKRGNQDEIARFLNNIGGIYLDQNKLLQAEAAFIKCLSIAQAKGNKHMEALVLRNLLELKVVQGDYKKALAYGLRSVSLYKILGEAEGIADDYYQIANIYVNSNKADSALFFAKQSLSLAKKLGFDRNIHNTFEILAKAYAAKRNYRQAYEYHVLYNIYKDSLTGEDKQHEVAALKFQYELEKKQSQIEILKKDQQIKAQQTHQQRLAMYALVTGLVLVLLFTAVLIRSNNQKRRDNKLLREQKAEIDTQARDLQHANNELFNQTETVTKQRDHLEATLQELRVTQSQLIQREKMASLGELTAGIAHEIQNPLNFVNNFSEVNKELLIEMKDEIDKGNFHDVKVLANDVIDNHEKINHHGKRADAIVKGMLQQRSQSGRRQVIPVGDLRPCHGRSLQTGASDPARSFNRPHRERRVPSFSYDFHRPRGQARASRGWVTPRAAGQSPRS